MEGARKRLTPAELRVSPFFLHSFFNSSFRFNSSISNGFLLPPQAEQRKRAQQSSPTSDLVAKSIELPASFQSSPVVPKKQNPFEKQSFNQSERSSGKGSGFVIPEFLRPNTSAAKAQKKTRRAEREGEGEDGDQEGSNDESDEEEEELEDGLDLTASDLGENSLEINEKEGGEKEGPKVRFLSLDEILLESDFKTFKKAENEAKGNKKRPHPSSSDLNALEEGEDLESRLDSPNGELIGSPEKKLVNSLFIFLTFPPFLNSPCVRKKLNSEPSEAETFFSPNVKRDLPDKSLLTVLMEHHQRNSVKSLHESHDAELRDAVFLLEEFAHQGPHIPSLFLPIGLKFKFKFEFPSFARRCQGETVERTISLSPDRLDPQASHLVFLPDIVPVVQQAQ